MRVAPRLFPGNPFRLAGSVMLANSVTLECLNGELASATSSPSLPACWSAAGCSTELRGHDRTAGCATDFVSL
jgi:hypothetical protein